MILIKEWQNAKLFADEQCFIYGREDSENSIKVLNLNKGIINQIEDISHRAYVDLFISGYLGTSPADAANIAYMTGENFRSHYGLLNAYK